jgi:hypothetical protein
VSAKRQNNLCGTVIRGMRTESLGQALWHKNGRNHQRRKKSKIPIFEIKNEMLVAVAETSFEAQRFQERKDIQRLLRERVEISVTV